VRVPNERGEREERIAEFVTTVLGLPALRAWLAAHRELLNRGGRERFIITIVSRGSIATRARSENAHRRRVEVERLDARVLEAGG
jgi:hypothetical protein